MAHLLLLLHLSGGVATAIISVLTFLPRQNSGLLTLRLIRVLIILLTLQTTSGSLLSLEKNASVASYCTNIMMYYFLVGIVLYRLVVRQAVGQKLPIIIALSLNLIIFLATTLLLNISLPNSLG